MENVVNVAQHIFDEYKKISGETIDELKLHKLLYFSQREHIAITGEPMFLDDFEGWKHGPVNRTVRFLFTPDGLNYVCENISTESAYIVRNVIEEYGYIESWKLSEISHNETSWKNSRKGLAKDDIGDKPLKMEDIYLDAEKVRPYDHVWDMFYDEFEDAEVHT